MKTNKILNLLLCAIMAMTLASCDDDEPHRYWDDLLGGWESEYGVDEYGEYDISGYDVIRYEFYSDYTGQYSYYSTYGLTYIGFNWYVQGDVLLLDYYDGTNERVYYDFDNWGYLILSPDPSFYYYTAYRPTWW